MATRRETRVKTFDEATLAARRAAVRDAEDRRRSAYPAAWLDPNYYADPRNAHTATWLTSQAAQSPNVESHWYRMQIANHATMLGDEQQQAINMYLSRGFVSPGTAAALASAAQSIGINGDVMDAIATLDATYTTMANDQAMAAAQGSEAEKGRLARALGGTTRPLFALMSMPFEYVYGSLRNGVGQISEHGWGGLTRMGDVPAWEQTLGGQYIRGLIDPRYSADLGSGWFPGGDVHHRQVQAARNAAPLVHGRAWTPGRGTASLFIEDPESRTYRNVSGFIDLVANVVLDPLVLLGGGASAARTAAGGRRAAEAVRISETAKLAEADRILRSPDAWLAPASDHVRKAAKEFTDAQRANGQHRVAQRVATATDRRDAAVDMISLARSDAATPARTAVSDVEVANRLKTAMDSVGDEGIGALASRVSRDSPDLPGVFTREMPTQNSSLIGAHDGVDAVVNINKTTPRLVSVDDLVDVSQLGRDIRALNAPKRAKQRAIETLDRVRKADGPDSMETLLAIAARDRTGGTIAAALRGQGVDGVSDVFRITSGEGGGVWWLTPDVDVIKWIDGTWQAIDPSAAARTSRLTQLERDARSASRQLGRANQDANAAKRVATELSDHYDQVMNGLTDVSNAPDAVRTAVGYMLGERRRLGGRPDVDHQSVKEFFFGTAKGFESATEAGASAGQKAVIAADRALIGAVTLGASEAVRAAKKLAVDPVITRARQRVLRDLTQLDDTAENLGRLFRLTKGRVDPNALRAALRATDEDGVLAALAPHMGVQMTRPITPSLIDMGKASLAEVSMGRSNTHLFQRGAQWMIDEIERLGSIAPRGMVTLNFADQTGSANTLRNYLDNIPLLDSKTSDDIVGAYLRADTEPGRARAVMTGFNQVSDAIIDRHKQLSGLSDETRKGLKTALRDAVQIYDGGRAEVTTFWTRRYVADAKQSVMTTGGRTVPLPGPQLEAELARGGVVLPSAQRLRDSIGRWGAFLEDGTLGPVRVGEKLPSAVQKARDVVSGANDLWRSSVLFRPAYVMRNIGEMQSRMFLTGHSSVFRHPLAIAAFAAATDPNAGPTKRLLAKFAKANTTADGKTFSRVDVDGLRAFDEDLQLFAEAAGRSTSRLDMRTHRAMEAFHGLEQVGVGKPGFALGWAEQLMQMRGDRLMRVVAGQDPDDVARLVSRGADREDAIVQWLLSSAEGRSIRRRYADSSPEYEAIFGNPRAGIPGDPVAVREFLFTAEGSMAKRLAYYTHGNDDLRRYVSTGVLERQGQSLFQHGIITKDPNLYAQEMMNRATRLSKALSPFHDDLKRANPDAQLHMRVLRARADKSPFKLFDSLFDSFFNWSGRMESAYAVGPEFAYAYYEKLAQLLPAVRLADRQKVFEAIKGSQSKLQLMSETSRVARQNMKISKDGVLNIEDVSAMAARHASEHVKTFFYDAMRRNQFFHAMRVVWPFAQSFVDTLSRWGSLIGQRPYMVQKVGRLGTALTEEGSGVIYDNFDYIDPFTNRESHDPSQGFLYNDPQTGEMMFSFPLIGSVLGAALSPVAGVMTGEPMDLASAMQLKAPLRNLNIALQGDVDYLPGAGPLITFPMNVLFPDDAFGAFPEWMRAYLFPYGRLRFEEGVVESGLFPTWARRLTGALYSDEYRSYSVKGSMAYLLSTREYTGFRDDPGVAEEFMEDVRTMSSFMALIRAMGAFALPAAPTQDIFAADTDGGLIATGYLADRWHAVMDDVGRDTERATAVFAETYGLATIAAVAGPSTEGEVPFSGPAWEFFKGNPERGKGFADVLGYFFPGDYSMEANQWARQSSRRRRLSERERTDNVLEFLYFGERRMLEGRAAQEGWDDGAMRQAIDELNASYADVIPVFEVGNADRELAKVRRALDRFPELRSTRGGEGTAAIFDAYDAYIDQVERRWGPGSTLSSRRAEPLRNQFLNELDQILAQYGGYNMEEGSVDTIAQMFTRLVTPRE